MDLSALKALSVPDIAASQRALQLCDLSSARVPVKKARPRPCQRTPTSESLDAGSGGLQSHTPTPPFTPSYVPSQLEALMRKAPKLLPTERSLLSPRAWGGLEKAVAQQVGQDKPLPEGSSSPPASVSIPLRIGCGCRNR